MIIGEKVTEKQQQKICRKTYHLVDQVCRPQWLGAPNKSKRPQWLGAPNKSKRPQWLGAPNKSKSLIRCENCTEWRALASEVVLEICRSSWWLVTSWPFVVTSLTSLLGFGASWCSKRRRSKKKDKVKSKSSSWRKILFETNLLEGIHREIFHPPSISKFLGSLIKSLLLVVKSGTNFTKSWRIQGREDGEQHVLP